MSASSVRYSVGDELDPLVIGEVTKELIAEYSRVSHDPNPMHTDEELARSAGHPTVFAQGMLGMAFLARHLTDLAGVGNLRRKRRGIRFKLGCYPQRLVDNLLSHCPLCSIFQTYFQDA